MSPRRVLLTGVVAILALIVSVWLVGERSASDVRHSEARARDRQSDQLRQGCARGVARDFEALGTNRDLMGFARDAAVARRRDGNEGTAARYEATAARAEVRMARVRLRLPAREDEATVAKFCRDLYPVPDG